MKDARIPFHLTDNRTQTCGNRRPNYGKEESLKKRENVASLNFIIKAKSLQRVIQELNFKTSILNVIFVNIDYSMNAFLFYFPLLISFFDYHFMFKR